MNQYTIHFNDLRRRWIAKYRKREDLTKWGTWTAKKEFERKHAVEAEQAFLSWYGAHLIGAPAPIKPMGGKTIAMMWERWLKLRYEDNTGTKLNTYNGLEQSMRCWVLDNPDPRFKHYSIQNVDIERDWTVEVSRLWINSLTGSESKILKSINCLRSFFNDCIGEEWLDPEMISPLNKIPIARLIKRIQAKRVRDHVITVMQPADLHTMLTTKHGKIKDFRKVRYLVHVATGLRLEEGQGLIWADVHLDAPIPYLDIQRQLVVAGSLPFQNYDDMKSKEAIESSVKAVCSDPKYHSKRLVPLHPLAVKVLAYWKQYGWKAHTGFAPQDKDPVFGRSRVSLKEGNQAGDFTCVIDSAQTLRIDLKRLGLPTQDKGHDLVFHSLRHTCMTMLENAGVTMDRIDVICGHKGKSVASNHYIAKNLEPLYADVCKLPLPAFVQLSHVKVEANSNKYAELQKNSEPVVAREQHSSAPNPEKVSEVA